MPTLSSTNKASIRWHLGYVTDAIPTGDAALLEDRLGKDYEAALITRITTAIADCDYALEHMQLDKQESGITYKRLITGDVNRNDTEYRAEPIWRRRKEYYRCCDVLSRVFGVPNYAHPKNNDWIHYGAVRL